MNAIAKPAPDDYAARRDRHLRQCEELGELGMELARVAQGEALRDLQPPTVRSKPVPGLPPGYTPPGLTATRDDRFGHLFAQLARCVRQTMLLEARLAAGAFDHPAAVRAASPQPAPPVAALAFKPSTQQETKPRLRPEPLEDEISADAHRSPAEILAGVCSELSQVLESGLASDHPNSAAQSPLRRTTIPPAREAPLTSVERAAILYDQQRATPPPYTDDSR